MPPTPHWPLEDPLGAHHSLATEGIEAGPARLLQNSAPQHCEQPPPGLLIENVNQARWGWCGGLCPSALDDQPVSSPSVCPVDASGPRILAFLHPPALSEAALAADPRRFCSPDLRRLLAPILDGTSGAATPSVPPATRRPQSPLPVSSPSQVSPQHPGCFGLWLESCCSLGLSCSLCAVGRLG